MRIPGVSTAAMAYPVLIFALAFGFLRHLDDLSPVAWDWPILATGLLPMATALALGLPPLLRHGRRARFAIGFQAVGWAATLAVVAACLAYPDLLGVISNSFTATHRSVRSIAWNGRPAIPEPAGLLESCGDALVALLGVDEAEFLALVAPIMTFFSLPPLFAALAGGSVARLIDRSPVRVA